MSTSLHQRNFSSSTTVTTTGKSEVYSAFDDDYDIPDAEIARKRKMKFYLTLGVCTLVIVASAIGGGIAYLNQHKVVEDRQVVQSGSSGSVALPSSSSTENSLSSTLVSIVSTTTTSDGGFPTSISYRSLSFGTPTTSVLSTPTITSLPSFPFHPLPTPTENNSLPPPNHSSVPPAPINSIPTPGAENQSNNLAPTFKSPPPILTPELVPTMLLIPSPSPSLRSQPASILTGFSSVNALAAVPSPSASPSSNLEVNVQLSTFFAKVSTGDLTHFPGSPSARSPLACGDVYLSPSTTPFVALCHKTFDVTPGSTQTTLVNPNKSPSCGQYSDGRKDLFGNWITKGNGKDWVVVGGDEELSCVGVEGVKCHIPRTIAITYGSNTIKSVLVVDRNQSECSPSDLDASDFVYRTLAGTSLQDDNEGLGISLKNVTWVWE